VVVVSPADYQQWLAGNLEVPSGAESQEQEPAGQKLLADAGCLACHSVDGSRLIGPTFKGLFGSSVKVVTGGKERTIVADEAYLISSISDPGADVVVGFRNIMPSSKDTLSDQQIGDLVDYIKELK
jgi:cytochrome c oxidase subunit II